MKFEDFAVEVAHMLSTYCYLRIFGRLFAVSKSTKQANAVTEVFFMEKEEERRFAFVEVPGDPKTELGSLRNRGCLVVALFTGGVQVGVVIDDKYFDWNYQQKEIRQYRSEKLNG